MSVCLHCKLVLALFLLTYTFSSGYTVNYSVVSEGPSVEASLSDVCYVYFCSYVHDNLRLHKFSCGAAPPTRSMQFIKDVSQPIMAAIN